MPDRLLLESGTYGYLLEDGSGVLLLESRFRLDVSGVDLLSGPSVAGGPTVTNAAYRQCGTMTFRVVGEPGDLAIIAENPVVFWDSWTGAIYFGGLIKTVTPVAGECTPGWRVLDIECQDYTVLPGMSVITAEPDPTGLTDKEFITAVFGLYDTKGIVIGTECQVVATSVLSESEASFLGDTLAEFLDELCRATGASWYVDYSKRLHYFVTESEVAPFGISDTPDDVETFICSDLLLPEDSIDLKNVVYYYPGEGGDAVPTEYKDQVSIDAVAAACGDNGRREAFQRDEKITTQATLDRYGAAFLAANAKKHPGSFTCWQPGLRAGMWINITSADDGLSAAPFAIVSVRTRLVQIGETLADSYVVFDVAFGDRPATLGGTMAKIANKSVGVLAQVDAALANQIALDYARGLRRIPIVTSLPSLPDAAFPDGFPIVLTTDAMLYISSGTDWIINSDASHVIAGSVVAAAVVATVVVANVANIGDTVIIGAAGIVITEGAITVTNAGSVVIIDGTSDLFKVGATGTLTIASGPAQHAQTTVSLDNISPGIGSWPSNKPANNFFTTGAILPYIVFDLANGAIVSIQTGGTVAGTDAGTTKASFTWANINDPTIVGSSATVRYYIFSEATL